MTSDDPLRVLFVCGADFTGPDERQALGFCQELLARGHAAMMSIVGDMSTQSSERATDVAGLRVHRHRFAGPWLTPGDRRAGRAFRPTVVHAWGCRVSVAQACRGYSAATGAPVFVHLADDEWGLMSAGPRWRRLLWPLRPTLWPHATARSLRWLLHHARALDAITPTLADHVLRRSGRPATPLLPVLPDPPAGEADLADLPRAHRLVAYTGALAGVHAADVGVAIRATALLRERGHDVRFVHAGGVAKGVDACALALQAGLEEHAASFLGHLPFASVGALLARADVLVQPGAPSEFNRLRLPSKLQAYLASGTPTITFAAGFGEMVADGEEVLKTHTASAEELADRIGSILADPALAARLGAGGRRAAERLFDRARNTEALLAHYRAHL